MWEQLAFISGNLASQTSPPKVPFSSSGGQLSLDNKFFFFFKWGFLLNCSILYDQKINYTYADMIHKYMKMYFSFIA